MNSAERLVKLFRETATFIRNEKTIDISARFMEEINWKMRQIIKK